MNHPRLLLTEREAAEAIGFKPRTLGIWRQRGGGPAFVRVSCRAIRYTPESLSEWIEQRLRISTSDSGGA